jgi:hypothetical protein
MIITMENLKELESTEMLEISGGVNVAYEVGYALGSFFKKFVVLKTIVELL